MCVCVCVKRVPQNWTWKLCCCLSVKCNCNSNCRQLIFVWEMLAGRMQGAFFKLELDNVMSSYFIDKSFIENIQINQKNHATYKWTHVTYTYDISSILCSYIVDVSSFSYIYMLCYMMFTYHPNIAHYKYNNTRFTTRSNPIQFILIRFLSTTWYT